jgi:hypothetical protein
MRPRILRSSSSTVTAPALTRSEPKLPQLVPHSSITTESDLSACGEKEPEPITLPATSPGRTWSTNGGSTVSALLHLAVVGLVAIAISGSFGGFFFLAVRTHGTVPFSEPNRAHPLQSSFEPASVSHEAGIPRSHTADAASDLSSAPRAPASDAPKSMLSVKIGPGLEQAAGPSASLGETANPPPTSELNSTFSQGAIDTHAEKQPTGVHDPPNRDEGPSPSVRAHSARSLISHKAARVGSAGRVVTRVTKKTKHVEQTLRPPPTGAADPSTQRALDRSAVQ